MVGDGAGQFRRVATALLSLYNAFVTRPFVFFLLLILSACSAYRPPRIPFLTPPAEDEDVRIAREFRREARKRLKLVQHPEVDRYLDGIGRRILSAMGPQPFEYRFFVVENSQLNAFAVPGGSVYVHTGLLERAKTTDELAGVLGHEIVHVKSRHVARLSGPDPASLLALLGAFLAGSGPGGQAAAALGQAIAATRQLSYSRQLEQEADTLGVRYVAQAGYNPAAIVDFLKTIDQERILNPIDLPPYLMTHPITQDRIANVEIVIRSLNVKASKPQREDPIKRIQILLRLERHEGDKVIEELERLLSENPEDAGLMHLLGVAYHYRGNLAAAKKMYERARALNPEGGPIDRDLGRLYTDLGEFKSAHEAFDRALKIEAKEPLNHFYKGELLEKESRLPEAVAAYQRAHTQSPLWALPPYKLGVVYGQMKRLGDAHYYLGRSYLLLDEDEKALVNFERALRIFGPSSPKGQMIKEEIQALKARRR